MSSRLVYCLRYANPKAAVAWLEQAFGARPRLVVPGEGPEDVEHAQLELAGAIVMLGPWRDDEFGALQTIPAQASGKVTASAYVIVDDVDTHHARAVAAGARIAIAPRDEDYGGRGYTCVDPEGHVWSFGTYDPWAEA